MASGPAAAAAEPAGPRGHGRPSRQGPRLFRINQAIRAGDHEGLKQLLAQGPPPKVPRLGEHGDFICFSYDGSEGSDFYGTRDEQDPFYTLLLEGGSQDSRVAMCEALLAAGFRPTVYPEVGFEARAPGDGEFIDRLELRNFNILFGWERPDVAAKLAKFERGVPAPVAAVQLDGPNRLLAMLIKGEPWRPADHQHYPPAFRAAVRTLLLAHCRSGSAADTQRGTRSGARRAAVEGQFCALSQLEPECLMEVVRHMAQPPLAPWLLKQTWREVEVPDREAMYAGMEIWDEQFF